MTTTAGLLMMAAIFIQALWIAHLHQRVNRQEQLIFQMLGTIVQVTKMLGIQGSQQIVQGNAIKEIAEASAALTKMILEAIKKHEQQTD